MSLLFKPPHIEAIRNETKTVTRRDWAEGYHRPSPGDIRMAVTQMFASDEECDCYVRVTDVYREPLGEMADEDARKEGGYDMDDFREAWIDINGEWDPDLVVDVIEFEYIGRERPEASAHA